MIHIHNGTLLSCKKEQNWAICSDVDNLESVLQSEVREKQTSFINAYTRNLDNGIWFNFNLTIKRYMALFAISFESNVHI